MIRIFLLAAFTISSLFGMTQSYEGVDFWFSYMPNSSNNSGESHQIHFVSRFDTEAYIEIPIGGAPIYDTIVVPKETMVTYNILPLGRSLPTNSEVVTNKGIHVTMKDPSIVYIGNYKPYTSDASIAIPTTALGTDYEIVSYTFTEVGDSEFVIIAPEDNTQISLTYGGETLGGRDIGETQNVTLNRGQTFLVKARTSTPIVPPPTDASYKDLTGTKITSPNGKKFAVYTGNQCVYVGGCPFCDHLMEQMRPTTTWGKTYYFAATNKSSLSSDVIRIYATLDGTTFTFNGAPQLLNAGQHIDLDAPAGAVIESNNPIHVSQFLRGSSCSTPPLELDPLMMDVLPVEQFSPYYIFGTSGYGRYGSHYATVVIESSETASLLLNDGPMPPVTWIPIAGTTYSYGYMDLAGGASYVLESSTLANFGLFVYGYGVEESYGYTAGGNLISLDGCPSPNFIWEDVCLGEDMEFTDLSVDPEFDIDQWVWDFGDATTPTVINGIGSVSDTRHTYGSPGTYEVSLSVQNTSDPVCIKTVKYTVEVFDNPVVDAGLDQDICDGDSVQLSGVIAGGATPYSVIQWTGSNIDNSLTASTFATPNSDGRYILQVRDKNDCTHSDSLDVTVDEKPTVSLGALPDLCEGESTQLIVNYDGTDSIWVTVRNTLSYFEELKNTHNGETTTITPPSNTEYWISEATKKEGNPLCISIDPTPVPINILPLPDASIFGDASICIGMDTGFYVVATGTGPWNLTYTENGSVKTNSLSDDTTYIETNGLTDSTTFTLTGIEYNGDPKCPVEISGSIDIAVNPESSAGTNTEKAVCNTLEVYELLDNMEGDPDPNGVWTSNTPGAALSGNRITPNNMIGGVYSFTYTVPGLAPCPDVSAEFLVTITTAPVITNIAEICTPAEDEYYVTGIIQGGDPASYNPSSGSIVFDGTNYIFTSDNIPSGTPYSITITDDFNCGIIEMEGFKKCNCLTSAGTMFQDTLIQICENEIIDGTDLFGNDIVDDGDDAFVWVLHDGSGTSLGNVIDFNPTEPVFNYPSGINFGTTYYISTLAGNAGGGTYGIDLSDPCLDLSQGSPVKFFELPTVNLGNDTLLCVGESSKIPLTFTGFQPFSLVNTTGDSLHGFSANDFLVITPSLDTTFTFVEVIGQKCKNTANESVDIALLQAPSADISGGNVYCIGSGESPEVQVVIDGDGTTYSLTYNINGGGLDSNITIGNLSKGSQTLSGIPNLGVGNHQVTPVTLTDNSTISCPELLEGFADVIVNALPDVTLSFNATELCFGDTLWITPTVTPNQDQIDITFENVTTGWDTVFAAVSNGQKLFIIPQTGIFDYAATLATHTVTMCSKAITDAPVSIKINPAPVAEIFTNGQYCIGSDSTRVQVDISGVSPFTINILRDGVPVFAQNQTVTGNTLEFTEFLNPGLYEYTLGYLSDNSLGSCLGSALRIDSSRVSPLPTANFADNKIEICSGEFASIELDVNGFGTISAQIREIISGSTQSVFGDNSTPGITLTNNLIDSVYYVIDNIYDSSTPNVCTNTSSDTLPIYVNPLPNLDLGMNASTLEICEGNGVKLDVNSVIAKNIKAFFTDLQTGQPATINLSNGFGQRTMPNQLPGWVYFRLDSAQNNYGAQCTNYFSDLDSAFVRPIPTAGLYFDDDFICELGTTNLNITAQGSHNMVVNLQETNDSLTGLYPINIGQTLTLPLMPSSDVTATILNVEYATAPLCSNNSNIGANASDQLEVHALPKGAFTSPDGRICLGESYTIEMALDLDNPVTITLSDPFGVITSTSTSNSDINFVVTPLNLGTTPYFITSIVDTYGCVGTIDDSVAVLTLDAPVVQFESPIIDGCPPVTPQFVNTSVGNYASCLWNFGDGSPTSNDCSGVSHVYNTTGEYHVSLTLETEEGCVNTEVKENYIHVFPVPEADFQFLPNNPTTRNSTVLFNNTSLGADYYTWRFDSLEMASDRNPSFQFPFEEEGTYWIDLWVENTFGCTDSIRKPLRVEEVLSVNIPNTFTPDDDGINDLFIPVLDGYDPEFHQYLFIVFDRWGVPIFETDVIGEGWDGKDKDGSYTKSDSFVYLVEVRGKNNANRKRFTGPINLIR